MGTGRFPGFWLEDLLNLPDFTLKSAEETWVMCSTVVSSCLGREFAVDIVSGRRAGPEKLHSDPRPGLYGSGKEAAPLLACLVMTFLNGAGVPPQAPPIGATAGLEDPVGKMPLWVF